MALSLKDFNRASLVVVTAANLVAYIVLATVGLDFEKFSELLSRYETYLPASLAAVVVGVLNAQLDHLTKARLVFWRWNHPLPGSRAFTEIVAIDTRIDTAALRRLHDPLPIEPSEQNRLWFKWYREFRDEPAIKQVHREYLFTRDWCGLSLLFALTLIPLAFWQLDQHLAVIFSAFIGVQYLLVRIAARNHGTRFVASVLAYKSTSN